MDNIHIGNMVKAELLKQDLTISWLARQVHHDASNMNKLLQKPSMHIDLLFHISTILQHDFFADISELYQNNRVNFTQNLGKNGTSKTSKKENEK